jgi:hypothetical protein
VAWRVWAALGHLRTNLGDATAARAAYSNAARIVEGVAENVAEEELRSTFLNSEAVQGVLNGAHGKLAGEQL